MKRTPFNLVFIVGAAAIGVCLGFVVHGGRHPRVAADAVSSDLPSASAGVGLHHRTNAASSGSTLGKPQGIDDSPLATQLARDLSMSEGVTRWLYWMQAVERATAGDMPRLARLAAGNATATRLVATRWVELAPRPMFDTLAAWSVPGSGFPGTEWMSILLDDWLQKDPDAVVAAMNSPGAVAVGASFKHRVANAVIETDVERGLKLMAEWRVSGIGPGTSRVAAWADADPKHAAAFVIANPAGAASRAVMEAIGKAWAVRNPASAMDFATAEGGPLHRVLAESTLGEWARRDLNAASGWLAKADPAVRSRLSPPFLEAWGIQDPAAALAWTESNFTGPTLERAVTGLLKGAVERDLAAAAGLVSSMTSSPARAAAAAVVASKWFPGYGSDKPVNPGAVEWLTTLDRAAVDKVLSEVGYTWVANDPRGMAEFLTGPGRGSASLNTCSDLVRDWVRRDPKEAMAWVARLPPENQPLVEETAFREWSRWQFDSAFQWLGAMPSDDPRRGRYRDAAIRTVAFETDATAKLAALNPADRAAARAVVGNLPIPESQRERLIEALR